MKIVAWGDLGKRLAETVADRETIWITNPLNIAKRERRRYRIVSTDQSAVYAY